MMTEPIIKNECKTDAEKKSSTKTIRNKWKNNNNLTEVFNTSERECKETFYEVNNSKIAKGNNLQPNFQFLKNVSFQDAKICSSDKYMQNELCDDILDELEKSIDLIKKEEKNVNKNGRDKMKPQKINDIKDDLEGTIKDDLKPKETIKDDLKIEESIKDESKKDQENDEKLSKKQNFFFSSAIDDIKNEAKQKKEMQSVCKNKINLNEQTKEIIQKPKIYSSQNAFLISSQSFIEKHINKILSKNEEIKKESQEEKPTENMHRSFSSFMISPLKSENDSDISLVKHINIKEKKEKEKEKEKKKLFVPPFFLDNKPTNDFFEETQPSSEFEKQLFEKPKKKKRNCIFIQNPKNIDESKNEEEENCYSSNLFSLFDENLDVNFDGLISKTGQNFEDSSNNSIEYNDKEKKQNDNKIKITKKNLSKHGEKNEDQISKKSKEKPTKNKKEEQKIAHNSIKSEVKSKEFENIKNQNERKRKKTSVKKKDDNEGAIDKYFQDWFEPKDELTPIPPKDSTKKRKSQPNNPKTKNTNLLLLSDD